jgi:hypothetical protein
MEGKESLNELEVSLKAAGLQLQQLQLGPLLISQPNGMMRRYNIKPLK